MSDVTRLIRDPKRLDAVRRTGLLDTPPEEVFDRLTRLATRVLDVPVSFLSLVEDDRDFYKSQCGFGEPLSSSRQLEGTTFCHYAIPRTEPLIINDTRADPVYRQVPTVESLGVAAYAGIPLVTSDGQPIGSFCAVDFKPRSWTETDVEVLSELAASAMREIELRMEVTERMEAERELRERERMAALGAEVGVAVIEGGSLRHVLQRCAQALVTHLDAAFARIWTLDEPSQILHLQASAGMYTNLNGSHASVPVGELKIGRIASQREPILTNDVQNDPRVSDRAWARREGMVAFAGYPLVVEHRLFGVVALFARHPLGEKDLDALRAVADRIALAVARIRAEDERNLLLERERAARAEAERHAVEEAALRRAAEAVTASFTVEETSRRIVESALDATRASGAFIERIDIERGELVVIAGAGSFTPSLGARLAYEGSFTQLVVERAEAELIPEICAAGRPLPDGMAQACGQCSALVVPLISGGEPIGALLLLRQPDEQPFRPEEVERARTFGNLAALAFHKIHLFEDAQRRRVELERVTESRARLIRGFSHDLKNPLGAADGHAQLLEDGILGELAPRQMESVGRIRATIRSALDLINDLVELARAEAGQVEVEIAPTDVREVAREMVAEYRAQAEAVGLSMSTKLPDELPAIPSDPSRVRQILGNLISNAIKYNRAGGCVHVWVGLRDRGDARPGRWVAVDVADTGPGIAPEKQDLLFREFSRLDPGAAQGVGLGLAISQRLAQVLGGEITAESEPGRGSTFTLWLPADPGSR